MLEELSNDPWEDKVLCIFNIYRWCILLTENQTRIQSRSDSMDIVQVDCEGSFSFLLIHEMDLTSSPALKSWDLSQHNSFFILFGRKQNTKLKPAWASMPFLCVPPPAVTTIAGPYKDHGRRRVSGFVPRGSQLAPNRPAFLVISSG